MDRAARFLKVSDTNLIMLFVRQAGPRILAPEHLDLLCNGAMCLRHAGATKGSWA